MQSIAKYLCNYSKAMTSNGKQLSIVKYSYVLVHVKVVQTNIAKYPKYLNCWISYPLLISAVLRERRRYQIGWIFGKFPKGEGSFSIQKFMLQILGTLNRAFWSWNWYKIVISGFRVCFFNNCIEKNQNKTHFEEGTSEFQKITYTTSICKNTGRIRALFYRTRVRSLGMLVTN